METWKVTVICLSIVVTLLSVSMRWYMTFCQGDSSRQLLDPEITSGFVQGFTQSYGISFGRWAELKLTDLLMTIYLHKVDCFMIQEPANCLVRIFAGTPTILPEVPRDFLQSFFAKATSIPRFWPCASSINDFVFQLRTVWDPANIP
jgi:hypothetical protein